jgi:hypothetical protein
MNSSCFAIERQTDETLWEGAGPHRLQVSLRIPIFRHDRSIGRIGVRYAHPSLGEQKWLITESAENMTEKLEAGRDARPVRCVSCVFLNVERFDRD